MDRLTYDFQIGGSHCWQVKGADNLECREVCQRQEDRGCTDCPIAKAFDRLAAYEETGLEPGEIEQLKGEVFGLRLDKQELEQYRALGPIDRLRELKQADDEGRCVVLKCKPNATVWFIKSAFSTAHFPIEGNHVSIKGVACDGDIYCSAITAYNKISRSFYMSDIGKTVFLTREEAEAALRREQEKEEAEHETS